MSKLPPRQVGQWRYGKLDDAVGWQTAVNLYTLDRLESALLAADDVAGAYGGRMLGFYRVVEAEKLTRDRAHIQRVEPWLTLEVVPGESAVAEEFLGRAVVAACDEVRDAFAWEHGPATRVTLLTDEVDEPWLPNRHGYCVDKAEYTKICLPVRLTDHPEEFAGAVRHEYAHVMTGHRTKGQCPRWLDEAFAMIAEGAEVSPHDFRVGHAAWLGPRELDRAFQQDRESADGARVVRAAYRQSALIGAFLRDHGGTQTMGRLLDAFADNSLIGEITLRVTGQSHEDEALRQVYQIGVESLFEQALVKIR